MQGDQGQRDEHQAEPERGDDQRAEQSARVAGVHGQPGEPERPTGDGGGASQDHRPGADPRHQSRGQRRRGDDADGERHVGDARPDRAVAEDGLHEQGEEEEQAEQRGRDAQHDQVGARSVAIGEQPHRQQRVGTAQFDEHERHEQHRRRDQRCQHLHVTPVRHTVGPRGRLGQAVDEQRHPRGAGDRARHVDPARPARPFGQHTRRRHRHHEPDRHVDEQHPPPGGVGGQDAAQQQAHRAAGACHRRVDAERPVAFPPSGKLAVISASAVGAITAPPTPWTARAVSSPTDWWRSRQQRRGGEQQQPEDEHPPSAENVTGAAAQQEQAAEGDRVGVDHPFQAAAGEAERLCTCGNATLTMVESSTTISWAVAMTSNARPRRRSLSAPDAGDVTVVSLGDGFPDRPRLFVSKVRGRHPIPVIGRRAVSGRRWCAVAA